MSLAWLHPRYTVAPLESMLAARAKGAKIKAETIPTAEVVKVEHCPLGFSR